MSTMMPKTDLQKMMLFMFLGLLFAIFVLGFSRSPKASAATGKALRTANTRETSEPSSRSSATEDYPSNRSQY